MSFHIFNFVGRMTGFEPVIIYNFLQMLFWLLVYRLTYILLFGGIMGVEPKFNQFKIDALMAIKSVIPFF